MTVQLCACRGRVHYVTEGCFRRAPQHAGEDCGREAALRGPEAESGAVRVQSAGPDGRGMGPSAHTEHEHSAPARYDGQLAPTLGHTAVFRNVLQSSYRQPNKNRRTM